VAMIDAATPPSATCSQGRQRRGGALEVPIPYSPFDPLWPSEELFRLRQLRRGVEVGSLALP
jgi:hypothetical protein